jgi:hypothetical protein
MTRVAPSAMMFATVSGCAQTAVVRAVKTDVDSAGGRSRGSAGRSKKRRTKPGRRKAKKS